MRNVNWRNGGRKNSDMKVLIDTNVIVDYLAERDPFFISAKEIIEACQNETIFGCVSSQSIADIYYILRKDFSVSERKRILLALCRLLHVEGVDRVKLTTALENDDFSDFEDCLQMQCAIAFGADYIVTRNEKDFVYSSVRAISPECFCGKYLEK